jgi:hypothetical protein
MNNRIHWMWHYLAADALSTTSEHELGTLEQTMLEYVVALYQRYLDHHQRSKQKYIDLMITSFSLMNLTECIE